MNSSHPLLWKLYAGVLGAAAAAAATKLVTGVWRQATGDEPPQLDDPDAPTKDLMLWAVASAAGAAVAAVAMNRIAASSWKSFMGEPAPIKRSR